MNVYDDVKFDLDETGKTFGIPLSIVFLVFLYSARITSILNSHGLSFSNKELLFSYCLGAAVTFLVFEMLLITLNTTDSSGNIVSRIRKVVPLSRFFKVKSIASFVLYVTVVWPAVAGGFIFLLTVYDFLVFVPVDYINFTIMAIPFIVYLALFIPVKVMYIRLDSKL